MNERLKDIELYMDLAYRVAKRSYCERAQVGALLVRGRHILSYGWNGMPHGLPNKCECEDGKTKDEVIHAEENAIAKVAASTSSTQGSTLIVTLAPCRPCARIIIQSEIDTVIYDQPYEGNSPQGKGLLHECGVQVFQLDQIR